MMHALLAVGGVVAGASAILCTRYLANAGLFTTITVTEKECPGYRFAFKTHTSAYKECGPYFEALCKLAEPFGKSDMCTIGLYLDDPKSVPADKTRYAVGLAIPSGASDLEAKLKQEGYSVADLPPRQAIHATFPHTGMLSIILGVTRVYPKMDAYCAAHGKHAAPYLEVTRCAGHAQGLTEFFGVFGDKRAAYFLGLQEPAEYAKANPK